MIRSLPEIMREPLFSPYLEDLRSEGYSGWMTCEMSHSKWEIETGYQSIAPDPKAHLFIDLLEERWTLLMQTCFPTLRSWSFINSVPVFSCSSVHVFTCMCVCVVVIMIMVFCIFFDIKVQEFDKDVSYSKEKFLYSI